VRCVISLCFIWLSEDIAIYFIVFPFRDKQEKLGRLTEEMKKDISLRENNSFYRSSSSMYSRKEKALKIYTFDTGTDRGEAEGSNDSANQHPDLD